MSMDLIAIVLSTSLAAGSAYPQDAPSVETVAGAPVSGVEGLRLPDAEELHRRTVRAGSFSSSASPRLQDPDGPRINDLLVFAAVVGLVVMVLNAKHQAEKAMARALSDGLLR